MAKAAINRSEKIREYHAANPGAKAADIQAGLKKAGIKVSTPLIYNAIRGTGPKKKKRRRRVAKEALPATNGAPKDAISLNALMEAKKLVKSLGSIDEAKKALAALTKLGS